MKRTTDGRERTPEFIALEATLRREGFSAESMAALAKMEDGQILGYARPLKVAGFADDAVVKLLASHRPLSLEVALDLKAAGYSDAGILERLPQGDGLSRYNVALLAELKETGIAERESFALDRMLGVETEWVREQKTAGISDKELVRLAERAGDPLGLSLEYIEEKRAEGFGAYWLCDRARERGLPTPMPWELRPMRFAGISDEAIAALWDVDGPHNVAPRLKRAGFSDAALPQALSILKWRSPEVIRWVEAQRRAGVPEEEILAQAQDRDAMRKLCPPPPRTDRAARAGEAATKDGPSMAANAFWAFAPPALQLRRKLLTEAHPELGEEAYRDAELALILDAVGPATREHAYVAEQQKML